MKYKYHYTLLILQVFLLIYLLTHISSCIIPRYCEGFDLSDRKNITFRINDTIIYHSDHLGSKDSLVFIVSDFYCTGASEWIDITIAPDYECYDEAYYETNSIEGILIREYLFGKEMEVRIGNDVYSSFYLGYYTTTHAETCGSDYNITYSYVMIEDTKCYCWTLNDLSGTRRFDSFTKMENKGIVEFHDRQTGKLWKMNR